MIPVLLTKIKTRDNVILDGIAVLPRRRSDTALVWIHGLGSSFARNQTLIKELSGQCVKNRIAYFKFNTRGHDIVNRNASKGDTLYGAGFEKFEECVSDIRAMIGYTRKLGYKKIILAGHSTGANKSLYYLYKTKDRAVKGLILLGPVNDIAAGRKKFGKTELARGVKIAEKLFQRNPEALMPQSYGISSAARFLSMFRQETNEDTFPYLTLHAKWKALKSIRVPIAVIIGERDEYLDPVRSPSRRRRDGSPDGASGLTSHGASSPAQKLIDIFRANARWTKSFSGVIIKTADHGFRRKERQLSREIIHWIKRGVV
ncbi:MAG: alpha/beta fold hydrolase [Candidatus Sungiibacteriota bacterium]